MIAEVFSHCYLEIALGIILLVEFEFRKIYVINVLLYVNLSI